MDKEYLKQIINTLRTTTIPQTYHKFISPNGCACALGAIYLFEGNTPRPEGPINTPAFIQYYIDIAHWIDKFREKTSPQVEQLIITLNDKNQLSFTQIADRLEASYL